MFLTRKLYSPSDDKVGIEWYTHFPVFDRQPGEPPAIHGIPKDPYSYVGSSGNHGVPKDPYSYIGSSESHLLSHDPKAAEWSIIDFDG